jgi:hypothetical protein
MPHIHSKEGIIGILGNHDSWEMIKPLERLGIVMLINEAMKIRRDNDSIWVLGLDDPHYYKCDDYHKANRGIPEEAFRLLVSHSTGTLFKLDSEPVNFYLCGHTHAGQIRLPLLGPVITHSKLKGPFVYGPGNISILRAIRPPGSEPQPCLCVIILIRKLWSSPCKKVTVMSVSSYEIRL